MRSPRPSPRRLALLGATGSIGRQVCDLVERHPDRFTLHALIAGSDGAALEAVALRLIDKEVIDGDELRSLIQSHDPGLKLVPGTLAVETRKPLPVVTEPTEGDTPARLAEGGAN